MAINVAITDDHPLAIAGLRDILNKIPNIRVTEAYHNGETLLNGLQETVPDVLLLDLKLPDYEGIALMEIIRKQYPALKVIAITSHDAPIYVKLMIQAGCNGYLLKNTDIDHLKLAIQDVYYGKTYIDPLLKDEYKHKAVLAGGNSKDKPILTRRESDVLQLIVEEYTNKEIADKLFLSLRTVEKHRFTLLNKFGAKNTAGLVKHALELGFIK